jgi:ribulose 1,5-bisphosphate carboxylase large subunit-like protein
MRYAKKISELWNGGVEILRSDEKTKSAKDAK